MSFLKCISTWCFDDSANVTECGNCLAGLNDSVVLIDNALVCIVNSCIDDCSAVCLQEYFADCPFSRCHQDFLCWQLQLNEAECNLTDCPQCTSNLSMNDTNTVRNALVCQASSLCNGERVVLVAKRHLS